MAKPLEDLKDVTVQALAVLELDVNGDTFFVWCLLSPPPARPCTRCKSVHFYEHKFEL